MHSVRIRLNAETTTICVRDGWLIVDVADAEAVRAQLADANGERLITVAEVSRRTGFTAGAVRDWIKRAILPAVRIGKEFRVREAELVKLIGGGASAPEIRSASNRIGRRRKAITV
jgi:excisionase family DNA binding protein